MRAQKPFENDQSKGEGLYAYELLIEWDKEELINKAVEEEIQSMIAKEDDAVDLENKDKISFSLFKKIIEEKM